MTRPHPGNPKLTSGVSPKPAPTQFAMCTGLENPQFPDSTAFQGRFPMIHLDMGALARPALNDFRQVCQRAALQFTDNPPVATWFYALGVAASREQERRGDAASTRERWPLQVPWQLPDDLPRSAATDLLDYILSATAALEEATYHPCATCRTHHLPRRVRGAGRGARSAPRREPPHPSPAGRRLPAPRWRATRWRRGGGVMALRGHRNAQDARKGHLWYIRPSAPGAWRRACTPHAGVIHLGSTVNVASPPIVGSPARRSARRLPDGLPVVRSR